MNEVGFEMLVFSWNSGINMESTDPKYIEEIRAVVNYGKQMGIEVKSKYLLIPVGI